MTHVKGNTYIIPKSVLLNAAKHGHYVARLVFRDASGRIVFTFNQNPSPAV